MSPPWMPFYPADYLKDTNRLSLAEHGAYLLLICEYWQQGELPNDEDELRRIARMTEGEWRKSRNALRRLFLDGWKHKRIDKELTKARELSEKKRANARKRWGDGDTSGHADASERDADAYAPAKQMHHSVSRDSSQYTELSGETRVLEPFRPTGDPSTGEVTPYPDTGSDRHDRGATVGDDELRRRLQVVA